MSSYASLPRPLWLVEGMYTVYRNCGQLTVNFSMLLVTVAKSLNGETHGVVGAIPDMLLSQGTSATTASLSAEKKLLPREGWHMPTVGDWPVFGAEAMSSSSSALMTKLRVSNACTARVTKGRQRFCLELCTYIISG